MTDCLFSAAKALRGRNAHLLLHEAMINLWGYRRRHPNCGYYDFDNPSTTQAEFIEMLKQPLGALILQADFPQMEQLFLEHQFLIRFSYERSQ